MKQFKFNTDASHLTYGANETISGETEDYNPVFYNAFARSAQSAEMLRNTLQRVDQKRQFVDRLLIALFFTLYGWKEDIII